MSNLSTILKYLPAFKKKFILSSTTKYGQQWLAVDKHKEPLSNWKAQYDDQRRKGIPITKEVLINHFNAQPKYSKKILSQNMGGGVVDAVWGMWGVCLNFDGFVSPIIIDADSDELIDLFEEKLRPQLIKHDIDYIEEYRGVDDERRHYILFADDLETKWTNALLTQFRLDAGVDKKDWFPEIYPYMDRDQALCSMPFGLYLKTMSVKWGRFGKNEITNLEEGMQSIIDCKPVTLDKLQSLLRATPKEEKKIYKILEKVIIKPTSDLPVPLDVPEYIAEVGKRCQAINRLLHNIQDPNAVEDHEVGLGLAAMATLNDNIHKDQEGKDWMGTLPLGVNSPEQNLLYYYPKRGGTPTCATWERLLNACEGCPFKGHITTPKQLYKAETIEREKIGEIRIASKEEIRAEVFPQVDKLIDNALDSNQRVDILLESVQDSGKSYYVDQLAVRLSREGKKVCISCNSTDVALEHKNRIEFNQDGSPTGAKAFIMASYNAIFEKFSNGITCPKSEEIQDLISLGVDSSYFKERYCKKCPYYDTCNYPKQYSQVQEEKYDIVIIQHAHMACTEVIRQLFAKEFDILIIDETFIDQITTQLKPTEAELELFEDIPEPSNWIKHLRKWLKGGNYPGPKLKPSRDDLKPLLALHKAKGIPYRVDQFIRLYNDDEWLDEAVGVMKFVPLPEPTVRLLTDATPSIEELRIVLDNPDIIRVGGGIVIDPSCYHERSKNYQILDSKASKQQMLKNEKLYEYLEWIGDLMRGKYKDLTALITVHMEAEQDAWDWLIRNYPETISRIQINHMSVGSNEWAKFNVQFILASPYIDYKTVREQVYKLKFIKNYFLRMKELPTEPNRYPGFLTSNSKPEKPLWKPVRRNHRDGIYNYPQFVYAVPCDKDEQLVSRRLIGKTQQAGRIRHGAGKVNIIYFLDSSPMDGMLIDEVFTEAEILNPIRIQE